MLKTKITGVAHYTPKRIVTNEEVFARYGTLTADQIFEKTGIKERRYCGKKTTTANMATTCIKKLLKKTNTDKSEIDLILVGTLTPDDFYISTATICARKLGINHSKFWSFDLRSACPSFLDSVRIANILIKSGEFKKIVVVGADRMSKTINNIDYRTGVLFGDGTGAFLLEPTTKSELGVNHCYSKTVPDHEDNVSFKTPLSCNDWGAEIFNFKGGKVYRNGVSLTANMINEYLEESKLSISDFDYIIPHQANMNMIRDIAKKLNTPVEKFLMNIENFGNTAAASVPLCFSQHHASGVLKKGNRVLAVSFGAGYQLSLMDSYVTI